MVLEWLVCLDEYLVLKVHATSIIATVDFSGYGTMDCRGVRRGSCSDCGCNEYDGGGGGKKCLGCGHVPAKHRSLSQPATTEVPGSQNYPRSPPRQWRVSVQQHYSGDHGKFILSPFMHMQVPIRYIIELAMHTSPTKQ